MKFIRIALSVLVAALLLSSCAGMAQSAAASAVGAIANGSVRSGGSAASSAAAASAAPAVVDFQSGEILCSADSGDMMAAGYDNAKVLTKASAATKNQAEVVFISDGKKSWVNYVVGSRKAVKEDFVVGATVFFLPGWADHDEISADVYRKYSWHLGNITSTEDLFKKRVEINGESYAIAYLRVPTDPIK